MEDKQLTSIPPTFTQKIEKPTYVVSVHFSGTSTETFKIPDSVTSIEEGAFVGCDSLTLIVET